jgi:hypothetical protein
MENKELDDLSCSVARKTLDAETSYQTKLEPIDQIVQSAQYIGAESILFMEVALLPPFVVLLIGSALFWAAKGFRAN